MNHHVERSGELAPRAAASSLPSGSVASQLRTAGYAVFRDVLPPARIDRLRSVVRAHLQAHGRPNYGGRYDLRGMNRQPELARTLCGDEIVRVMKACTSPELPVLTGECDLMADTTSGWHKDITDDMRLGPSLLFQEDFRVYKLAVYLQDQPEDSRLTLKVRPGTHRIMDGSGIAPTPLAVRAGDVLVFDVRLDHAGQIPTLPERLAHRAALRVAPLLGMDAEAAYTRARRAARALTGRGRSRLAVFMTFGPDSPALHAYERSGRHRHGPVPAELDRSAAAALAAGGVGIIQAG